MSPVAIGVGGFNRGKKPTSGGGTTFTLFPTSQSGRGGSTSPDPSIALNGTGLVVAIPGSDLTVGQFYYPGDSYDPERYDVYESFLAFDTSSITGTIISATLSLGLQFNQISSMNFVVQARLYDWGSTLESADWLAPAGLISKTILATLDTSTMGATGSYKAMTESGTALQTNINLTGFTRMILCSSRHASGIPPQDSEYVQFDSHASTNKPKLVVVTS